MCPHLTGVVNDMEKIRYEILDTIPVLNKDKKYFYFYKIVNEENKKFYYGVHSTKNLNDNYRGSSKALTKDIKTLGIQSFKKYILKFFESEEMMYAYENTIVNKEMVLRKDCYNMHTGGNGSWDFTLGKVCVKDLSGNTMMVDKDDASYLSGDLVSNMKGLVHVTTKTGENVTITKSEYYDNKGMYFVHNNNCVIAKDKEGNIKWVTKELFDDLKKTGELVGQTKNRGVFKDNSGNIIMCEINDSRVLSGELVGATKGKCVYKYRNDFSKIVATTKDDARVKSGELVGLNYGIIQCINPVTKEKVNVLKNDMRLKTGELITYTKYLRLVGKLSGNNKQLMTPGEFKEKYKEVFKFLDMKMPYKEIAQKTGLKEKKIQYIVCRYNKIKNRQL